MNSKEKRAFGKNLMHLMEKYDLTESDLAFKLGISQSAVNRWKHGVCPQGANLVNLANLFSITTATLLKDNEPCSIAIDDEENLLREYRLLTPEAKEKVMYSIHDMAHQCWRKRNKEMVANVF